LAQFPLSLADPSRRRLAAVRPLIAWAAAALLLAAAGPSGCTTLGVAVGAGAAAGVAVAEERSVEDAAKDTKIAFVIGEALFQTQIDDLFRPINIDVVEGRVMLTGMVKTQELADKAGEIAWKAEGVRHVYNDIQVGDGSLVDPVRDRWITTTLRSRLLADGSVYDINYSITTVAGVIHLIGIARDEAEHDRVRAYARDIAHVRRVVDHVLLKSDPQRLARPDES